MENYKDVKLSPQWEAFLYKKGLKKRLLIDLWVKCEDDELKFNEMIERLNKGMDSLCYVFNENDPDYDFWDGISMEASILGDFFNKIRLSPVLEEFLNKKGIRDLFISCLIIRCTREDTDVNEEIKNMPKWVHDAINLSFIWSRDDMITTNPHTFWQNINNEYADFYRENKKKYIKREKINIPEKLDSFLRVKGERKNFIATVMERVNSFSDINDVNCELKNRVNPILYCVPYYGSQQYKKWEKLSDEFEKLVELERY